MKKIGIVGGMAPESTASYYRIITELSLGTDSPKYPEIIIYSVDFGEFLRRMRSGNLQAVATLLGDAVSGLAKAGADFAVMASNTPHVVFDEVAAAASIPLISIAEETGKVAAKLGLRKVGLLGTMFTMQADFYWRALSEARGIAVYVPEQREQSYVHDRIMTELVKGQVTEETRQGLVDVARGMAERHGVEAIILGCTELPLALSAQTLGMPALDTTRIHAEAAVAFASVVLPK